MESPSTQASNSAVGRYRSYGLFGGAALGGVSGVLVSGPNFFVWSVAQSVGAIVGLAAAVALIGWLFAGLVVGGLVAGGTWAGTQDNASSSDVGGEGVGGGGSGD